MAQGNLRSVVAQTLLKDVLGSVVDPTVGGGWKVLVLDGLTTNIFSSALRMSDILDCQVSVVEDVFKKREPLTMAGVYFVTPSPESVQAIVNDYQKTPGTYPSVHIFFCSPVSGVVIDMIKKSPILTARLKTLKEVNLEFLTVDSRTLITANPYAPVRLMGEKCEVNRGEYEGELDFISTRLASVFSTLKEYPVIRYKTGKPPEEGDLPGANARAALTQRLANRVTEKVMKMQRAGQLPSRETCDLLILDRGFDPVAPVIHEWTYEALVYDLCNMDGNIYKYSSETQGGKAEEREIHLDERDDLWVQLRHVHIADAYQKVAGMFQDFQTKSKVAQYQGQKIDGSMSGSMIKKLIAAMPQHGEQLKLLSHHISVSTDIKEQTGARKLTDVGELEQELVFGENTSKDLIKFLMEPQNQNLHPTDKMRLFMCYLATHPGKLDVSTRNNWQKVARLSADDMNAVANLAYLGVSVSKAPSQGSKLSFIGKSKNKAVRKVREGREEGQFALSKFDPLLLDIVEDWANGKLPVDQYPYIRPPTDTESESTASARTATSARTNRTGVSWAKKQPGADSSATPGRRMIVFVIGGVVRSEMRVIHQLAKSLNRDIILASTSVETPSSFIDGLRKMNSFLTDSYTA